MARPRVYKTEAVVVGQSPIGEADRVVTLLSPERGKIRAVAKGVRRSAGKLTGHLELLSTVSVSIAEGRNLDIVTEAQCTRTLTSLRGDLDRVAAAMYAAELADAFSVPQEGVGRDPGIRRIYDLVTETLSRLNGGGPARELVSCYGVLLLSAAGLAPELMACVECGGSLARTDHALSASAGGIVCPRCVAGAPGPMLTVSVSAVKVLRHYAEAGLAGAESLRVPPAVSAEIARVLDAHLRHHLDRDPRSAGFLRSLAPGP